MAGDATPVVVGERGSGVAVQAGLARDVQKYHRWRNANARHPDVLAAQRRERVRV